MRDPILQALDNLIRELEVCRNEALKIKGLFIERQHESPFEEKTPVRPPSQQAMEAFQSSSDFLTGKKKL